MIKLRITSWALALLLAISCASKQKVSTLDPKINKNLKKYAIFLKDYKNRNAHLISPKNFTEAGEVLEKAREKAHEGGTFAQIELILNNGKKSFSKIDKNYDLANFHLEKVLNARSEAVEVNGNSLAVFKKADMELSELGRALEKKDINTVIDQRSNVESLYVNAEVQALQKDHLLVAETNISSARKMDAISYFDSLEKKAVKDLDSAKTLISRYKDDYWRFQKSIEKAENSSRRLLALTSTAQWLEDKGTKAIAMALDRDLNTVLQPLSVGNPEFLPYGEKIEIIKNETKTIPAILNELTVSQFDSYLKKRKLSKLSSSLADKKELDRKLKLIRSLYSTDEAKILFQGDDLIVRLVGLNFGFDKAQLPKGANKLLAKVAKTAKTLNYPEMRIIGHADSKGNPLYNEKLSRERAKTVNKFLVKRMKIPKNTIYVSGAGFRRPISENKTVEGREMNRRIDIVFNSVLN